jgi:hypothetical protein
MTPRREQLYISSDVVSDLWLIIKKHPPKIDDQGFERIINPDEMADEILRSVIREKYPQISEHRKAVRAMERELLKTL